MLKYASRFIIPVLVLSLHHSVFAAPPSLLFTEHKIVTEFNVSHPAISANILPGIGNEILVLGLNEQQQRVMAIYALDQKKNTLDLVDTVIVPNSIFAIDVGELSEGELQKLYFLSKNKIFQYIPNQLAQATDLIEVQSIGSMYLSDSADIIALRDFARDINDDGKDDFVIPHFEHLNLWLSNCCGHRHHQTLPIAAQLQVDNDSVKFAETQLYFVDLSLDGKTDVVMVEQGILNIYPQNLEKQFDQQVLQVKINESIHGLNWWDIIEADGQNLDQSDLRHRNVEYIDDFNDDNIADIAVRFTKSSGVLDRVNDYEFFFGRVSDQQLSYPEQSDTAIASEDTLSDLKLIDMDADGKKEVMLSSFDLGLSQIISALLSGSIDQDAVIFWMDENNQFIKKPLVTQEVEITFSLSSGRSGEPLLKAADVDGDGYKDLVFSDGDDQIHVLFATLHSKRKFAKRSLKQKLKVPKNASAAVHDDLNNDGKADFIFHYGRLDGNEMLNKLTVLIAN